MIPLTTRRRTTPWVKVVTLLCILSAMTVACGDDDDSAESTTARTTSTITTTTTTPTTTAPTTTTTTAPPTATLAGRVHLVDRDEPVSTTVYLYTGTDDKEMADSMETDAEGRFEFPITEPGDYSVRVSLIDYVDMCDKLRTVAPLPEGFTSAGWPVTVRILNSGGTSDILASTAPRNIDFDATGTLTWAELGDMPTGMDWVNDLALLCDE